MKKALLVVTIIALATTINFAQITSAGVKGLWNDAPTWVGGKVPAATDNVVIALGDTVTFSGANASCKDLTINGALQFNKNTICAVTINGNLLVAANASFKVQSNANSLPTGEFVNTLDLKGNLTHNGSVFDMRTGSSGSTLGVCNLTLSGTSNSTITLTTPYSSSNGEFNAVTINKTGSAKVVLGSNWYISGGSTTGPGTAQSNLVFVNGIVETGNFVFVHLSTTTATVSGYSNTSYVVGAMGRGISSSSASSKIFPIGDAKGLRPFTLYASTSGSATGHYGIVRCVAGNANTGTSTFAGGVDKVSAVRYYQIGYDFVVAGGSGTPAATMGFNNFKPSYGTDDGVVANSPNVRVAYSTNRALWTGLAQTTPDTVRFTSPAKQISTPDALTNAITLDAAAKTVMYAALAKATGTSDNTLTDIWDDNKELPTKFELSQNYPNPFNPSTAISYKVQAPSHVTLKVYDVLGNEVATLVNEFKQPGSYNYKLSIINYQLSSGVYFYRLTAGSFSATKKMLLLK